jgi:small nuclear ribonucleoprotein G
LQVHLKINGGRAVEGILRGYDPFMNLVLDETVEFTKTGGRNNIGMVVIRGNSVVLLDAKERI